jgi:hypothetical protein
MAHVTGRENSTWVDIRQAIAATRMTANGACSPLALAVAKDRNPPNSAGPRAAAKVRSGATSEARRRASQRPVRVQTAPSNAAGRGRPFVTETFGEAPTTSIAGWPVARFSEAERGNVPHARRAASMRAQRPRVAATKLGVARALARRATDHEIDISAVTSRAACAARPIDHGNVGAILCSFDPRYRARPDDRTSCTTRSTAPWRRAPGPASQAATRPGFVFAA